MSWTDHKWWTKSWNPITGCSLCSPGCENCYAKAVSDIFGVHNDFQVTWHIERLHKPSTWRKPQRIFTGSMTDMFHQDIDIDNLLLLWSIMASLPRHQFFILTKRPSRMQSIIRDEHFYFDRVCTHDAGVPYPAPNIWLGVTCCNQEEADRNIPVLLDIPAAHRFVSFEPLLEEISWGGFSDTSIKDLDWIIVGAETGTKRRQCHLKSIEMIVNSCKYRNIPVFVKAVNLPNGKQVKKFNQLPESVRFREM